MRHPTAILSESVGVPESTLRLLLTILLAYPVAIGFRCLHGNSDDPSKKQNNRPKENFTRSVDARNRYILVSGLALATFFNGVAVCHSLVTVAISYTICSLFQYQRTLAVAGVWLLNSVYLLGSYYVMAADDYDISFTMTQCILCLRLMGFSMDYMDGASTAATATNKTAAAKETVTRTGNPSQSRPLSFGANTALTTLPSFTQVAAYCFYPSAFLVGPQFSFSLYQEWLTFSNMHGTSSTTKSNQQYLYAMKCASWGVFYLAMQQLIGSHYPTSYLLTLEYANLKFLHRLGVFWLVGKFVFTKYLGIWLLTEGATALFGIGYEGKSKDGQHSFAGLANVNPLKYETATSIEDIIGSFNINTNLWSKYYVFKRLRWMGSKTASQTGTLAFLAIWHGFHYGYFTTFLMEFLDLKAEGILRKWVYILLPSLSSASQKQENGWLPYIKNGLAWCICSSTLFYAGVGFDLLSLSSSWVAYRQIYFIGHLCLFALLGSSFLLPAPPKSQKEKKN